MLNTIMETAATWMPTVDPATFLAAHHASPAARAPYAGVEFCPLSAVGLPAGGDAAATTGDAGSGASSDEQGTGLSGTARPLGSTGLRGTATPAGPRVRAQQLAPTGGVMVTAAIKQFVPTTTVRNEKHDPGTRVWSPPV